MKWMSLSLSLLIAACATTKCKTIDDDGRVRGPDDPIVQTSTPMTAPAAQELVPSGANSGTSTVNPPTTEIASVKVYKYDNSRQCGQGKPVDLEDMAKQLKGIKILTQEKLNDGMMRIQMCGAPTGNANVYGIEERDLKAAIKLGFREWKY